MIAKPKAGKAALQRLLDAEEFIRPWRFKIVAVGDGTVTVMIPLRKALLRPGGIVNGPALMAAADVVLWLAIKARHGIAYDALTSDRPYRRAWSRRDALTYIRSETGRHFDPSLTPEFIRMMLE